MFFNRKTSLISWFMSVLWAFGAVHLAPANALSKSSSDPKSVVPSCQFQSDSGRLAFLIGNSDYEIDSGRDPLANPAKDIVKLCGSFRNLGYSVIGISDARVDHTEAIVSLLQKASSNADSVVIYYAGHGFEYSGANFLVPIDAPTYADKELLQTEFLPLDVLLSAVGSVNDFALILLDACRTRDHVVTLSSSGEVDGEVTPLGLQQFKFDNQAVIFASQKGAVAYDSLQPTGPDTSPFAAAISEALLVPGLPLNEYFGNVTQYVRENTESFSHGQQKPFYYSGFGNVKYYLNEPEKLETGSLDQVRPLADTDISAMFPEEKIAVQDGAELVAFALSKHQSSRWIASANNGNAFAQYLVGTMFNNGVGTDEDKNQAEMWLRRSAAQEAAIGQTGLAYFLQKKDKQGSGNQAEIIDLFEKAVSKNFAKAQSHLGFALWNGDLGTTDKDRAKALFSAASKNGHPYATFADAYYGGKRQTAEARLRSMADAGTEDGNNWICELYYLEGRVAEVINDCRQAAEGGFAGSRAIYAEAFRYGWGVERNRKEANFWGQLALSQFDLAENKRQRLKKFVKSK